jgi:hypothetical protein
MELYKIINTIKPEVIFEELDLNSYNDHYGQEGPYSTETTAIYKYLQYNNIQHIPVDTYDMTNFTKEEKKYMDNIILNNNIEYRNIFEKQMKLVYSNGYKFLNGEECSLMLLELQKIERIVQEQLCDDKLTYIYKKWIKINNEREEEMIKNIYKYCKNNLFNSGLLITGADHRNSLKRKLQNYCDNDININWSYYSSN